MGFDWRKQKAIEGKYKKQILDASPLLENKSGIYFLTRTDEQGIKYAYIGQAKHVVDRLAQHFASPRQHIDRSLLKHKFYDVDINPFGWKIGAFYFPIIELDEREQHYIQLYAKNGYQLRNKTAGGQGSGKIQIDEYKERKGYRQGVEQGYKKASKEISHLFDLHLDFSTKKEIPTVNQKKALEKFQSFLDYYKQKEGD